MKLEDIQLQDFGRVEEVSITKDDTLMLRVSTGVYDCFWFGLAYQLAISSSKGCELSRLFREVCASHRSVQEM